VIRAGRSRLLAEAAVTILLMGAVPVLIRHSNANVYTIGIVRLAFAAGGLWLALLALGRLPRATPRQWATLAVLGLVFGAHWVTFFVSIKMASASIAVIGQSTFGVHLVVIGALIGHHRVTRLDAGAVGLAVAGSLLVAPEWRLGNADTAGFLLAIFSASLYAVLPIVHQRNADLPSSTRAFGQFLFGLCFFLLFLPQADFRLGLVDWWWLFVLGTACTLVAHTFWTRLSTRLPTLTTSVLYYLSVPVALALSATLLGEAVTLSMVAGAALIVAANLVRLLGAPAEAPIHQRAVPVNLEGDEDAAGV
jgi:drug/metabolite transporter (DMT)-like permease